MTVIHRLGKFTDDELTNFFMCILKEVVVFSNFSTLNNYKELNFDSSINGTTISVFVENKANRSINLTYDKTKIDVKDILNRKLH